MTAAEILALHPDRAAAAQALSRAPMEALVSLAYGEFAAEPMADVPPALASLAYDEIEKRCGMKPHWLFASPEELAK